MMFSLSPQQWAALAIAVGLLAWQFWPAISSLKTLWSRDTKSNEVGNQDVLDLIALQQVQKRFERRGCTHAAEHIAKLYACFFDGSG